MSNSLKPKYVPDILCPHCDAVFSVGSIKGGWLQRRCPKCGGLLSSEVYDRYIMEKINDHKVYLKKEREHRDIANRRYRIANGITKLTHIPLRWYLRKNADRHLKQANIFQDKYLVVNKKNPSAIMGRYYTSEWYQCSHHALQANDYIINASYKKNGDFQLTPANNSVIAKGLIGEWNVFETLMAYMQNSPDPHPLRLIPNGLIGQKVCPFLGC